MEMAAIVNQYYPEYLNKYGKKALPSHLKTLNAIRRCRTSGSGELYVKCPKCEHSEWKPMSCGNWHCPKCQNHATSQWIDKQQEKLLPVPYFMVTFTLPYELKSQAYHHQKLVYSLLFASVVSTLKSFGLNPKHLGAEIGTTMVLHTNSRRLSFHPHIPAVVPGGGIDKRSRLWKKVRSNNYLFHHKSLAKVFRARFLAGLRRQDLFPLTKYRGSGLSTAPREAREFQP
jgi:ribosomal protein L37AE/L43A